MKALEYDEVTATPESGKLWSVTFNTSEETLGWVLQYGNHFKAISTTKGDLGQQMTIKRAAHLVAVS